MKLDKMACACKGVTYRMIIMAVEKGARTFEEVQSLTRCATGCRRCEEFIRHFIRACLENSLITESSPLDLAPLSLWDSSLN